jgi:hypothetical protein
MTDVSAREFADTFPISGPCLKALDNTASAAVSEDKSPFRSDTQNAPGKDARAKVHDFVFVSFRLPCINTTT